VNINKYAMLLQPEAVGGNGNTATTPLVWGVETTFTAYKTIPDPSLPAFFTYSFSQTKVYGDDGSGTTAKYMPTSMAETPQPPATSAASPSRVLGPYGLVLDLFDLSTFIGTTAASKSIVIQWRLPTCEVTQTTSAESSYEKVECSNRGLCERSSGQCQCFSGYAGYNCAQQTVYV
jgi:hypothetical protein